MDNAIPIIVLVVQLAIGIVVLIGMIKLFTKAGEPGWAAIVPIYNFWILTTKIAREPASTFFLAIFLLPVCGIGLIWHFKICAGIAKNFGKETGFAIGLFLLAPVFYCILGFSDDEFRPAGGGGKRRSRRDDDYDDDDDDDYDDDPPPRKKGKPSSRRRDDDDDDDDDDYDDEDDDDYDDDPPPRRRRR